MPCQLRKQFIVRFCLDWRVPWSLHVFFEGQQRERLAPSGVVDGFFMNTETIRGVTVAPLRCFHVSGYQIAP